MLFRWKYKLIDAGVYSYNFPDAHFILKVKLAKKEPKTELSFNYNNKFCR